MSFEVTKQKLIHDSHDDDFMCDIMGAFQCIKCGNCTNIPLMQSWAFEIDKIKEYYNKDY